MRIILAMAIRRTGGWIGWCKGRWHGRPAGVRGWAAAVTVMEHAAEVASTAIRVCGGQSMTKALPLERMYRDSRLGSLMLPWSAEVCTERLARAGLYD